MSQPFLINAGRFIFNPIMENNDVTNSIGHTIHQILPKKTEITIISGHQYDHIINVDKLKFRRYLRKDGLLEYAEKPIIMNRIKHANVKSLIVLKKKGLISSLFIIYHLNLIKK